jgi:prepilin-type N-terminal cleavage/methylation domain-containing protein
MRNALRSGLQSGFSLVEVAVALLVAAVLLGIVLVPLQTQLSQRKTSQTQDALDRINEALIGFALANGYLPCPDKTTGAGAGTANDGLEDANAGSCVANDGNVPWATLGTPGVDSWGNFYHYRVASAFAQRSPQPTFTLATSGTLTVACPAPVCSPAYNHTTSAPAVVLSYGPNGYGAINSRTGAANPAPTGTDEVENANGNSVFVSRTVTAAGAGGGEFDDVVAWLSVPVLLNRMVAAGQLPK